MITTESIFDLSPAGAAFAAGARLLHQRYRLTTGAALCLQAAVLATALGPSARVRHPLGHDLPLSLDIIFRTEPGDLMNAAISGAFEMCQHAVHDKLRWRETAGRPSLRARFLDAYHALEAVENELRRTAEPAAAPSTSPVATAQPDMAEILRQKQKAARDQLLERRDYLRRDLAERRLDLLPFLVGEDVDWESLLGIDRLAFDSTFTNLSLTGAPLRELLACTPKRLTEIGRLLQASRRGTHLTRNTVVLLNPMIINVWSVSPDLLARAASDARLRGMGLLDGALMIDVAEPETSPLEAGAFLDETDEKPWNELVTKLLDLRIRGISRVYTLDVAGFDLLEDFRSWCRQAFEKLDRDTRRFFQDWPALLLKFALIFHVANGREESDTLDVSAVQLAVAVLKRLTTDQLSMLEAMSVNSESGALPTEPADVERMVAKLRLLGGSATVRDLFRTYNHQDYTALAPILERAVERGQIIREGKSLRLPSPGSLDSHEPGSAATPTARSA